MGSVVKTLLITLASLTPFIFAHALLFSSIVVPTKPYTTAVHPGLSAADPDPQFPQQDTELFDQLNATVHSTMLEPDWRDRKRGIAYSNPNYPQLFPTSKISWMYNWWSLPGGWTNVGYEFIPMLHSYRPEHTSIWFANVDHCQRVVGSVGVLSFNEPDQCGNGGACMQDIPFSVAQHKQWIEPLRAKYGAHLRIVSPSITNGAWSPEGTVMGLEWLKKFLSLCTDCQIDFVGIHWYDSFRNVDYFKRHVRDAYTATGKMVWITEFAAVNGSEDDKIWFLKQVIPWLDQQDFVFRYTYQFAVDGVLVQPGGGGLTKLGQVFSTM